MRYYRPSSNMGSIAIRRAKFSVILSHSPCFQNVRLRPSVLQQFTRPATTSVQDNIVHSKLADLPTLVSQVTVPELLRLPNFSDSLTAFECAKTGSVYTRGDLFRHSKSFAAALLKSGLKRGDIVGILLPNSPFYAVVSLGLLQAGLIGSYMNPAYTAGELKLLLSQAPVSAIVTLPALVPVIQALKKEPCGASVKHVVTVGPADGCHDLLAMLNTDYSGVEFITASNTDPVKSTAVILWSSGTTGPPKGTMITHTNIACSLLARSQPEVSNFTPGEEVLVGILPFFHIFGAMGMIFSGVYHGAKVVSLPNFEPEPFVKILQDHRPTYLHLVPPLVSFVASNPTVKRDGLKNIHTVVCGGAPSGPVLINRFLEKADKYIFFQEGYGMTETTGLSHVLLQEHKNTKINSVGHPVASTSSKIIDLEDGRALGANQRGEICVKGPQVMKGYVNNEEATKNTLDSEGWLHTGDVGYYTDEGIFYIVDRIKELIKVKGLQVAPTELEDILRKHKKVADVAVIGVPDERAGELPRAYIVSKDPSLTVDDVHQYMQTNVSHHKQLKGGIEFVDSIPKSPSGKCLRRVILEKYKSSSRV